MVEIFFNLISTFSKFLSTDLTHHQNLFFLNKTISLIVLFTQNFFNKNFVFEMNNHKN